ncbi:MAG: peptide deformylase [Deltaproteobacteria bacterium]|nr:peptide deformylase [Deltaproteobacteria bacterium]
MALRKILVWPDKRLEEKARPVVRVDDRIRKLLDDMAETMYAGEGVGLAATQIGEPARVAVIDVSGADEKVPLIRAINPEIVESEGRVTHEEGCLSLPEVREEIARFEKIKVRYKDPEGNTVETAAHGLLARVFQHEIDHLDGKLLFDRLSALKRGLIKRKLKKAKLNTREDREDHELRAAE